MVVESKCPDRLQWSDLLDCRLPEPEAAGLNHHLEGCARCQGMLEQLTAGEATWAEAARTLEQRPRPALQRAIEQLKAKGEAGRETVTPTTVGDATLPFLRRSADPECLGWLGAYRVMQVLGRGGMGVVLKAFDPALQRVVAIKVLSPQWASHEHARLRFEREARAAALVRHVNVVAIHAVAEVDNLPYLVMEYVPGMSLQQRLDQDGPLDLEEVLRIGEQTAAGLAAAHEQGLIHRDVKPANILLDAEGNVRLTDFGLARAVDDTSLTQTGVIAGTPQYMAPEQARGAPLDHRADLFSLGSVLYALCTGQAPFRAPTTVAVLRRVCEATPRDVCELNPEVPDWLAEIIDKLHEKKPRDRLQSADEVARLLGEYSAYLQSPETVRKPERLRRPRTSVLRYWWVAAGLLLGGAVSVPLLIWGLRFLPLPVQQPQQGQAKQEQVPQEQLPPAKDDVFFQRTRAELDDENVFTRQKALIRLATMKPNDQRAEVARKLLELMEHESPHLRRPAVAALATWGSKEEVPALLRAMEHQDPFTRREALKVIARFRDPQTLAPLIRSFRDFSTREDADKALRELGTMAEPAVLELLKERDVFLRKAAIQVLTDIGTEASVPALRDAATNGHPFVIEPAQQALAAIAGRQKQ